MCVMRGNFCPVLFVPRHPRFCTVLGGFCVPVGDFGTDHSVSSVSVFVSSLLYKYVVIFFVLYVDFGLLHMAVLYALPHTEVYVSLFVCVRMWVCVCVVCYISGDPGQNPGE